jgi:hypothetical protein
LFFSKLFLLNCFFNIELVENLALTFPTCFFLYFYFLFFAFSQNFIFFCVFFIIIFVDFIFLILSWLRI